MKKIILIFSCILILLNLFGCNKQVEVNKNYIDKNTCVFEVEFLDNSGGCCYDGIIKIYPENYDIKELIKNTDYYIERYENDESDVPLYSIAVGIVPNTNEKPYVYIRHANDDEIPIRYIDNLEDELIEMNLNLDNIVNKVIKFVKDKYKDLD